MKKLSIVFISLGLLLISALAQAEWTPDPNNELELSVQKSILEAKSKDDSLSKWFDSAYAYAVFPSIGKGGFVIGGAGGKGLVIRGDEAVAYTSMSQVSIGLQAGGQVYAEYIMFKDKTAFDHFARGNFEMGAQVSAVAVTAGASADADYDGGVAVFTLAGGGLMFEASVAGQKFKYKAK